MSSCVDCGAETPECPQDGMRCNDCAAARGREWVAARVEQTKTPALAGRRGRARR